MGGHESVPSSIEQVNRNTQNAGNPNAKVDNGCESHLATATPAATPPRRDRHTQDKVRLIFICTGVRSEHNTTKDVNWVEASSLSLLEVLHDLLPAQLPPRPDIQLAPYEIYVRTLLSEGHGLPCWEPRPLQPQAQPQGVVPGDVGTYTAESGFRRTFNLFDDAHTFEITQRTLRGPHSEYRDLERNLIHLPGILRKGHVCVHGSSLEPRQPDQLGAPFEFHRDSDAPAGAILALPSSADEDRLRDIDDMGEYVREHAEAIYRHASGIRPIGKQESLYIVSGCIKSDSWAMAAYRRGMDANHGSTLLLVPTLEAEGDPPKYEWSRQGSSRARAGWSDRKGVKNQCLFIQGFKLAFSPIFRSRVESRYSGGDNSTSPALLQAQGGEGHRDRANALRQGSPRSNDRAEQRSLHTHLIPGSRRLLSSKNPDIAHGSDAHGIICTPFPSRSKTPGCDIAICHDDSWRFFFKLCSSQRVTQEIPSQEDRSKTTGDLGHRAFDIQNGVAFLLPDACKAEQTIPHKANFFENPTASSSHRLYPSDVVVLVMGIVGAGRSTFINSLLPENHHGRKLAVSHMLDPYTTATESVILESQELSEALGVEKDYRLVLVDTPGLDSNAGSKHTPAAVVQDIVRWSKDRTPSLCIQSWHQRINVFNSRLPVGQKARGCAIFMRDIGSDGFQSEHNFTPFGSSFTLSSISPRLIIVTSKWEISDSNEAENRHKHLIEQFKQAEVLRLARREDAWEIMKELLPRIEGGSMLNLEGEEGEGDPHGRKKTKSLKSWVCMDTPEMM